MQPLDVLLERLVLRRLGIRVARTPECLLKAATLRFIERPVLLPLFFGYYMIDGGEPQTVLRCQRMMRPQCEDQHQRANVCH